jgi:hypothetical protein
MPISVRGIPMNHKIQKFEVAPLIENLNLVRDISNEVQCEELTTAVSDLRRAVFLVIADLTDTLMLKEQKIERLKLLLSQHGIEVLFVKTP